MRRLSLNARLAQEENSTDEIEICLIVIEHPALDEPVRLSTDNTERLSLSPLMYGTRSTWMGANPITEPYLFVLASAELPSDLDDAPASASIVLENVDNDIGAILRSVTDRATVHMAVVLASSPNLTEAEYREMKLVNADGDVGEVRLSFSREPIEDESYPTDRMTKQRFPGLHR